MSSASYKKVFPLKKTKESSLHVSGFTSDSKNLIAFSSTSIKVSASIQAISLDKTNALGPYHKDIKVQGEWYKFYQL